MAGSAAKVGLGAVLALGLVLAAPLAASAHIRVSPGQVAPGAANVQLTFSVPTEAVDAPEGERTTLVRVALDKAHPFASVYVQPVAGWTGTVETTPLPKPVTVGGKQLSEVVSAVVWTAEAGAGIPRDAFQNFTIAVTPVPDVGRLTMPATQQFSSGAVVRWDEPEPRGKGTSPDHPAPTLYITETPPEITGGMGGMAMGTSTSPAGTEETSSDSASPLPLGLAVAALAMGAGGLVLGGLAFARSRRRVPAEG